MQRVVEKADQNECKGADWIYSAISEPSATVLAAPTFNGFQDSRSQDRPPLNWIVEAVVAILKGGPHKQVEYYETMDLTCAICKCRYWLVRQHVSGFSMRNTLSYKSQEDRVTQNSKILFLMLRQESAGGEY